MKKMFLAVAICLTMATGSLAFEVPALRGRVNDYANLLSPTTEQNLERTLATLETGTTAQVVVLTVPDLQGLEVRDFGVKVAHKWHLGDKDLDNGLLLLYSVAENKAAMEVGYGLEGALPDSKTKQIGLKYFRPAANGGDFDTAFTATIGQIVAIIQTEYAADPTGASLSGTQGGDLAGVVFLIIAVVFIIVVVAIIFGGSGGGYSSGYGGGYSGGYSGGSRSSSSSSRSSGSSYSGGGGSFGGGGSSF